MARFLNSAAVLRRGDGPFRPLRRSSAAPVTPADYIVTSDAEWSTTIALGAATLSGKTIEVQGALGAVAINNTQPASLLTIRGGSGGSVRHIDLFGTTGNIRFLDMPFQMTGWPHTESALVQFEGGTFSYFDFDGCSFRHGYGPDQENFDPVATYPEYTRVDHVQTATTTSATYALSWLDPAMTSGWIEFFNRGAETVHVAVGGSGVTATTGSPSCAPGARLRIDGLDPTTDTHFAIITASGTSEVNARAEIGLVRYLADGFVSSGSSNIGTIIVRNCTLRDLASAIKGIAPAADLLVVMDNDLDRIYADLRAVSPKPGGQAYFLRNLSSVPFARSGIAEELNGDAGDPHGDDGQMFADGSGTISRVYSAYNWTRRGPRRAGVKSQGLFASDNNFNRSYDLIYSICDMYLGGATNGIASGEPGYPIGRMLAYANTVLDPTDIAGGVSAVRLTTADAGAVTISHTIAQNYIEEAAGDGFTVFNSLQVNTAADPAGLFPNIAGLEAATTRAALATAMTTAAEAAGIGAVALAPTCINTTTTDWTAVIQWQNVPSGVAWEALTSQAIDTQITLPLSQVTNPRADQAIVPGSGVEWRSVAEDKTTEVQGWTSASGTVQPGQWVQIRGQSSADPLTETTFGVTINGFSQGVSVTTTTAAPTVFHTQSGTGPYFTPPTADFGSLWVPADTTRMVWECNFRPTSLPASAAAKIFAQGSTGCDLGLLTANIWQLTVEQGNGTAVVSSQNATDGVTLDEWQTLILDVDQVAGTATLTKNGVEILSRTWTPDPAQDFFPTGRKVGFFSNTGTSNLLPAGWEIEYAQVQFTTAGVQSLYKRIEGNAATVNADAWKLGGDAT